MVSARIAPYAIALELYKEAEENFIKVFQNKDTPEDVITVSADKQEEVSNILLENGVIKSKSEFRRLVGEGAISLEGEKISDPFVRVQEGGVFKIGKKRFIKIIPE